MLIHENIPFSPAARYLSQGKYVQTQHMTQGPAYVTRELILAKHRLVGFICLVEPVVEDFIVCSLVVAVLCHLLVEGLANLLVLSLGSLAGSLHLLIPALSAGNTSLHMKRHLSSASRQARQSMA